MRVNIRKLKQLVWLLCAVTFAYAGWTFFDIYTAKERGDYSARKGSTFEDMLRKQVNDHVRVDAKQGFYPQERYTRLWEALVDGSRRQVEQPAEAAVSDEPPEIQVPDLSTIVEVSLVLYSLNPIERFVALNYLPAAAAEPEGKASRLHLSEGDPLMPPYDQPPYNGKVLSIGLQEVTFAWGDGEAKLTPELGATGEEPPMNQFEVAERIDATAGITQVPEESTELRPGVWLMGTRDLERIRENPQRFMEEDINVRTITAPGGGRTQIEITSVKGGSLAEKLGVKAGYKIISVNGIPMSSIASAINWAKANPDLPEYTIVYEYNGKQDTYVLHVM